MAEQFTQEQLQHYIDNPHEVDATDSKLIEALASAELDSLGVSEDDRKELGLDPPKGEAEDVEAKKIAAEAVAEAEAQAAKEAEDAKAKADAEAAKAKAGTDEVKEEGRVLSKDGKHTLPFEVLKEARERAAGAEAALAEAQQSLLAMQARAKALKAGEADPGQGEAKTADELEAVLEKVREEAPWLVKPMETLIGTVKVMGDKIAGYEQEREESEEQATARMQHAATAALEANPTLVLWKSQAPGLFNEAVTFDVAIRQNPAQAARFPTFESRYEQVVKLVRASHEGEGIPLPEAHTPSTAAPAKQPSAAELKARADAALKKAEDATSVRTLTDITGGEGEVSTEEQLGRMSSLDLADKFGKMSPHDVVNFVMTH